MNEKLTINKIFPICYLFVVFCLFFKSYAQFLLTEYLKMLKKQLYYV